MSSFDPFDAFADGSELDGIPADSLHSLEEEDEERVEFKMYVSLKTEEGLSAGEIEDALSQAIQDSAPVDIDVLEVKSRFREEESEQLEDGAEGDLTTLWPGEVLIYIALPDSDESTKEIMDNALLDIDVQDSDGVCHDIQLSLED